MKADKMKIERVLWKEELEAEVSLYKTLPAKFNNGDHAHIVMPRMGTVVIETPFGVITVCGMPFDVAGGGCFDIKLHTEDVKSKMIGFTKGGTDGVLEKSTLYSLDIGKKE